MRSALTGLRYQPIAATAVSNQQELEDENDEEEAVEVKEVKKTVLAGVRQHVREDTLSELTRWHNNM